MTKFIINKSKDYTVLSNYHLKDKNLSLKAKGLLSLMLSLPDDWDYSVKGLEQICNEAKNTINNILNELESNNYLTRRRLFFNGKISDWEYNIYEKNDLYRKNEDIENQDLENCDVNKSLLLHNKVLNNNILSFSKEINEILNYYNNCGELNKHVFTKIKTFKLTDKNKNAVKLITARLKEGRTVDNFKDIIFIKYFDFIENEYLIGNKSSSVYYFPDTLFQAGKFDKYLNEYRIFLENNNQE